MSAKTFRLSGRSRDSYLQLVLEFPLASIRSAKHLAEAQRVIDRLLAQGRADPGVSTYLDALSDLVSAYEDEHVPMESASDAAMLQHLMDAGGVSQIELSRETRIAKSTISEILAGKRPFSRQMLRKFADFFHVDIGILAANF